MTLPESFQRYGTSLLAEHAEIAHHWSTAADGLCLSIPRASADGFDVRCDVESDAVTLYWGNWHARFEPTEGADRLVEELFGLIRDMLSPDMRIRELRAAGSPYRGYLESFDGTRWSAEHAMGLMFWNYFGKRSVKIYIARPDVEVA